MESEKQLMEPLNPKSIGNLNTEKDENVTEKSSAMDLIQAAKELEPEKIHSILQQGVSPNVQDEQGRTALHWIMCFDCHCATCMENAETSLYVLFHRQGITDPNVPDKEGFTPLHLAAENQLDKCAKILIWQGADLFRFTHAGDQAIKMVAKKLPDVYVHVLNMSLHLGESEPNSEKCSLKIDFSVLVGQTEQMVETKKILKEEMRGYSKKNWTTNHRHPHYHHRSCRNDNELSLLRSLLTSSKFSRQKIFGHPAVAIFLDQKWRRVCKQFWATFIAYIFWLIMYTSYVLYVYLIKCPCKFYNATMKHGKVADMPDDDTRENLTMAHVNESESGRACLEASEFNAGLFLLFALTLVMTLNEVVKIIITPKLYFKSRLNVLHWILIILVHVTYWPTFGRQTLISEEQYQVAAVTIFLAWSLILSQIAKFPKIGQHMDVFGHVLRQFWSFLLTYVSLFIAFALAFCILFPSDKPYTIFPFAFLKIFVMMVGEMEYNDMFYNAENDQASGPFVGHVLYATFVIVVAIVLMNLLIGMTVSDIKSLQKEAELSRVCRQIIDMFHLESFLFSDKIPDFIKKTCQKMTSVVEEKEETIKESVNFHNSTKTPHEQEIVQSKYTFVFYPNDSNDASVPEKLKASALELAVRIQTEKKGKTCAKKKCFLLSKIGIKKEEPVEIPSPSADPPLVSNF